MKARKAAGRSPIVVSGGRTRRRLRSPRDEVLGAEALETPMPGSLLVLLSRLARSEKASTDDDKNG